MHWAQVALIIPTDNVVYKLSETGNVIGLRKIPVHCGHTHMPCQIGCLSLQVIERGERMMLPDQTVATQALEMEKNNASLFFCL